MSELFFNINNGYLEGLVRGFKGGVLKQADYLNLVQCETLEGEWWSCDAILMDLIQGSRYSKGFTTNSR